MNGGIMETRPTRLVRDVRDDEILAFYRDGAALVRGIVEPRWIETMRRAVDRVLERRGEFSFDHQERHRPGRFRDDLFLWRRDPDFDAFMRSSPMPELAARVLGCQTVRFFYDQLLVKEPGTEQATPWHQDLPYWPLRGSQNVSIWVPFDRSTVENGVVQYLAGSHLWGRSFAPRPFGIDPGERFERHVAAVGLEPVPDVESARGPQRILCWEVEPGDVILHHPLTLHFAAGNGTASHRRRALSLRYVGDEACWHENPGSFLASPEFASLRPLVALRDGEALSGELFPAVWPR
jgi:ectoine hydroxylase-related dioxygenase (phytanoyl-CoA dioxygenase family)